MSIRYCYGDIDETMAKSLLFMSEYIYIDYCVLGKNFHTGYLWLRSLVWLKTRIETHVLSSLQRIAVFAMANLFASVNRIFVEIGISNNFLFVVVNSSLRHGEPLRLGEPHLH